MSQQFHNTDNAKPTKLIAMWSGPRNLSTAMMYSFAQRSDCHTIDEPYYAAYLSATGIEHGMYQEVIRAGEINPEKVAAFCTSQNDQPKPLCYQKHMSKHMISRFDRGWVDEVCSVFLIRDPARVIASYHAREQDPELSDIGVKEQVELFDRVSQKTGVAPVVIHSEDILTAPEPMLRSLCIAIDIEFQSSMLNWPAGPKSYDGVWAPHWYKSVWQSTGFAAADNRTVQVPDHLLTLLDKANAYYDQLKPYTLTGT